MKKTILIFLLIALALFLFSCNRVESDGGKDSQTDFETEKNADTQLDTGGLPDDVVPADTATCEGGWVYSLQYGRMVILEIGEICELKYVPSENQPEYVGVGVNIVQDFEETFNQTNYEENRLKRMEFVAEDVRERIFDEYDDVIVIEASMLDEIPVGATVFTPLFGEKLNGESKRKSASFFEIRPLLLFSERTDDTEYGCERVLELMYVTDGKISIPERIKKGSGLHYYEGNTFIYALEEANRNLIKVGRENQLFYDGMTIEELKNYIRTASNNFWFRSLHENEGN